MPTRYSLDGIEQLKTQLGNESLKEVSQREEAKKAVKKSFEEKFQVLLVPRFANYRPERTNGFSRLFVSRI
jgi:Ribosomal L27e protein family